MIEPKTIPLYEVYPNHPRDESLQAFKEWLEAITGRIQGSSEENRSISKYEWIYLWKDFWAKFWAKSRG